MIDKNTPDKTLPFFAYGVFRPGEISFLGIKEYVERVEKVKVCGSLRLWDGVLLFDEEGDEEVYGYIIYFKKNKIENAYDFIESIESTNECKEAKDSKKIKRIPLYQWDVIDVIGVNDEKHKVNILVRNQFNKAPLKEAADEWDTVWKDPYFILEGKDSAINLLKKYSPPKFDQSFKHLFDLQMHYLLLWTIIERFSFFRYGVKCSINERLDCLSNDVYFSCKIAPLKNSREKRELYSSDEGRRLLFDYNPIKYYHQIRNNVVHRGKALTATSRDYNLLKNSFIELLEIIEYVLIKTKEDCDKIKRQYENRKN